MTNEEVFQSAPVLHGTETPFLDGATSAPTSVVYTTQHTRFILIGKMCMFSIRMVITSMSKTTRTDQIWVHLPYYSSFDADAVFLVEAYACNATPVQVANRGRIIPGTPNCALFQVLPTAVEKAITYELLDPGIGDLTKTITIELSGMYQIA